MISVEPVVGITPFERADPGLVLALSRACALGVLDVGSDPGVAQEALALLARKARSFGVRLSSGGLGMSLPREARVVGLPAGVPVRPWIESRTVLVQVTSLTEARAALADGAHGLIAKGNESGGAVGDEPTFILLQRILAQVTAPVWAQGGIGLHTAGACI